MKARSTERSVMMRTGLAKYIKVRTAAVASTIREAACSFEYRWRWISSSLRRISGSESTEG
jgi:hypothetical protein